MSFRIYRLAKKETKGGKMEHTFAQVINCSNGRANRVVRKAQIAHRERRNSRRASFWSGFSFSNFSVTRAASPPWRRMASRRVTEAPSCMRRECRRTPQSGAVRILFAVLLNSVMERVVQVFWYI